MAAFVATLVGGPIELRGLRHSLTEWLGLADATDEVRDAVLLATHEAAANAMSHGEQDGPVSVSATQGEDGAFTVEVGNDGAWNEPEASHHGKGLTMMNELMAEVTVRPRTIVRMLSG
jgi:anti-sigma regulatory factor (Ser/Thr protein kinase)